MKIVFAGTPEFAAQAMRAIDAAGHQIVLALTQPDRRAGRGMHLQASPVKEFALEKNIPVLRRRSRGLRRRGCGAGSPGYRRPWCRSGRGRRACQSAP